MFTEPVYDKSHFTEKEKKETINLLTIKSVFCAEEASKRTKYGTTRTERQIAECTPGDKPKNNCTEHHLAGIAN